VGSGIVAAAIPIGPLDDLLLIFGRFLFREEFLAPKLSWPFKRRDGGV
jgi:hypothetical protein